MRRVERRWVEKVEGERGRGSREEEGKGERGGASASPHVAQFSSSWRAEKRRRKQKRGEKRAALHLVFYSAEFASRPLARGREGGVALFFSCLVSRVLPSRKGEAWSVAPRLGLFCFPFLPEPTLAGSLLSNHDIQRRHEGKKRRKARRERASKESLIEQRVSVGESTKRASTDSLHQFSDASQRPFPSLRFPAFRARACALFERTAQCRLIRGKAAPCRVKREQEKFERRGRTHLLGSSSGLLGKQRSHLDRAASRKRLTGDRRGLADLEGPAHEVGGERGGHCWKRWEVGKERSKVSGDGNRRKL